MLWTKSCSPFWTQHGSRCISWVHHHSASPLADRARAGTALRLRHRKDAAGEPWTESVVGGTGGIVNDAADEDDGG